MNAFKNINLSEYFQRYGIHYGIRRILFTANPLHVVTDYQNKKLLYYCKTSKKLQKLITKGESYNPDGLRFNNLYNEVNTIWVYWKQGLDKAPKIVKKCIESIKKNANNSVIILSDENIDEYIKLPNSIVEKNKLGKISNAALSDLIRFSLLEHYGGTWIDATVLLTGPLPDYILNSDFFAYQDSTGSIRNLALYSNWLLHCKKSNLIMKKIRNVSFAYWQEKKYVIDYLWEYIIMTLIIQKTSDFQEKIPYANSDYSYLLLKELGNKVNKYTLEHILDLTNVHKLTYKITDVAINDPKNVYNLILKNKLWDYKNEEN